jgi:uncharacterized protein YodC (DUF2158 family)
LRHIEGRTKQRGILVAAKPKFKPGDLVELKSGSPVMTIEKLDTDFPNTFNGGYHCSWFAGAKNNHRCFEEAALKPAEVDE